MFYRLAADFVVLIHFLWIVFLTFGAFMGRRYRAVKIFHIAGLGFAITMQIFGWYCPLTHLEIWLRKRHNPSLNYSGSFIIHYVEKLVYIDLSPEIIFVLTLVLISASVYLYLKKGG
ncbi:MAG: DUF2784 domain-containing protein [Thermodesulfovibrionales bacterium]|nr:DUF2784 domain-containing protein [Thermodesulfovibrionales bacterium]